MGKIFTRKMGKAKDLISRVRQSVSQSVFQTDDRKQKENGTGVRRGTGGQS